LRARARRGARPGAPRESARTRRGGGGARDSELPAPPSFTLVAADTPELVAAAYDLLDAAARALLSRGFVHWLYSARGKSPALVARLAEAPTSAVLVALDAAGAPLGTATISALPLSVYYDEAAWEEPGAPAAYLANLAVDPARARGGLGRALVAAAAAEARARWGARWLRCDAVAEVPRLAEFYTRAGFAVRGASVALPLPNPFAGGRAEAPAAPGRAPYVANPSAPPPADDPAVVTCVCWEAPIRDS